MANKLYEETHIQNIANAIRGKTGKTATMKVSQMASEISEITTGGSDPVLQEKTVSENGVVTPDSGYDGLSKVTVNVDSDSIVIDGMHKVTFFDSGEKIGFYYVKNNTGVQAPTDANGETGKYTLTEGSSTAESFPYVVLNDLTFYKIFINITLPSPYKSYVIYSNYGTNEWFLVLADTTGFRRYPSSSNNRLYGLGGSAYMISKTFSTFEEAVAELLRISLTQDVSEYKNITSDGNRPTMGSGAPNYSYHSLHNVINFSDSSVFLNSNPYTG
jgi:hypothetical protein